MTNEEELRLYVAIWKQVAEEEAQARTARECDLEDLELSFQKMHRRAQKAEARLKMAMTALQKIVGKASYADDPWSIARTVLERVAKK